MVVWWWVARLRVGPFAAQQHGKQIESGRNNWKVSKTEGTAQFTVRSRPQPAASRESKDVLSCSDQPAELTDEERTKMEGIGSGTKCKMARVLWPRALVSFSVRSPLAKERAPRHLLCRRRQRVVRVPARERSRIAYR